MLVINTVVHSPLYNGWLASCVTWSLVFPLQVKWNWHHHIGWYWSAGETSLLWRGACHCITWSDACSQHSHLSHSPYRLLWEMIITVLKEDFMNLYCSYMTKISRKKFCGCLIWQHNVWKLLCTMPKQFSVFRIC